MFVEAGIKFFHSFLFQLSSCCLIKDTHVAPYKCILFVRRIFDHRFYIFQKHQKAMWFITRRVAISEKLQCINRKILLFIQSSSQRDVLFSRGLCFVFERVYSVLSSYYVLTFDPAQRNAIRKEVTHSNGQ